MTRIAAGPASCFLTIVLLCVSPGLAADFSAPPETNGAKIDYYPLLQIHAKRYSTVDSAVTLELMQDLFVSRGGATISVRVSRQGALAEKLKTEISRGFASEEALAGLKSAVGAAELGVQEDCEFQAVEPARGGTQEITWYGRNGRWNQFTIHFGPDAAGGLPPCPDAVSQFVGAVERYGREVGVRPASAL